MEGGERKRRTVVIVGGGIAGALLSKSIDQIADAILIDPKEYFEIPWANLRSRVEPSFAERSVIHHKEYLKNGKLVISTAVGVTDKGVVTAEGRVVGYDFLVIATGHPYNTIRSRRDRLEKFQEAFALTIAAYVTSAHISCSGLLLRQRRAATVLMRSLPRRHRMTRCWDPARIPISSTSLNFFRHHSIDHSGDSAIAAGRGAAAHFQGFFPVPVVPPPSLR